MAPAATYFAAVYSVMRRRLPGLALWVVLGVAVLLRAVLVPTQPFLSTDIYRYVWDGRVQAAGITRIAASPPIRRWYCCATTRSSR